MTRNGDRRVRLAVAALTMLTCVAGPGAAAQASSQPSTASCDLGNGIKHVVDIQFDNVHYTRDDPNVASDLQQMPNLLNFLEGHGTVLTNDHDVLVHTATNFTSNQTGLYEDATGITQSNSGYYFDSAGNTHSMSSFGYWTDPVSATQSATSDNNYLMDYSADPADNPLSTSTDDPAPWVPFTRAGCNVGDIGMANEVLENVGSDVNTVFGAGSAQAAEAKANPTKAAADFEGLAVHCAQGAALCSSGQSDLLPDEPGGYSGYQALLGSAEIQPATSPSGPITNLDGTAIADSHGNDGFPGFDGLTPVNSLAYANDMLESGVQDVNVYISDAHSDHTSADSGDLGPGEQLYEQQLQQYNAAFGQFFTKLAAEGITAANTLFVATTDEGDHFSGSAPTPANCTGAPGNYCTYATKSEVNVDLAGLLATEDGDTQPYSIHSDPAPALWVGGNPAPSDPTLRQTERNIAALDFTNPLTGGTDHVADYIADPAEEKILHFVGADGARTPTLTAFSGEDDYITSGAANCTESCVYTSAGFAWNHGGVWPDMQDIWVAFAGPGIKHGGIDSATWADQTDTRPTVLALTGLKDDYTDNGRVLTEDVQTRALPAALRVAEPVVTALGEAYKQIDAVDGKFALATLAASTKGIASGSAANDSEYTATEAALTKLGSQRDALASKIDALLLGAEFGGRPVSPIAALGLLGQAKFLLIQANRLAATTQ
ncbi:MAG TPA: hypothetical protein VGM10_13420 [Actinocrinis sp.]